MIEDLHRWILDEILVHFEVRKLTERQKQRLNKVWQRLDPWPDSGSRQQQNAKKNR